MKLIPLLHDEHPDADVATPEDLQTTRREQRIRRLRLSFALVAVVTTTSVGTYAAVVGNWVPSVTGIHISEAQHEAELKTTSEASYDAGYSEGHESGTDAGELSGFAKGQEAGRESGYREGRSDGHSQGYDQGYDVGYEAGSDEGYVVGLADGWSAGCTFLFSGLGTDRVGNWWDYYYGPSYASYYSRSTCD